MLDRQKAESGWIGKMRNVDIAWIAGLVEGEGCISWNKGSDGYGTPQIQIAMTDQDVVAMAARILDSNVRGPYDKGPGNKPSFATSIGGQKAAAWLMTLFTFFGERRRSKAKEVLAQWRSLGPTRGKYSRKCVRGHDYDGYSSGQRTCSQCARIRYSERNQLTINGV
jgi:hypothetical protein